MIRPGLLLLNCHRKHLLKSGSYFLLLYYYYFKNSLITCRTMLDIKKLFWINAEGRADFLLSQCLFFSLSHSPFSSFLLYLALLLVSFSLISNLFYIHPYPLSTGGHNDISICTAPCYWWRNLPISAYLIPLILLTILRSSYYYSQFTDEANRDSESLSFYFSFV